MAEVARSTDRLTRVPPATKASTMHRLAILAEGHLNLNDAKTAVGVLRYSQDTVVAVIDSANAGRDCAAVLGDPAGPGRDIPVVADVAAALAHQPDTLLI